MFSEGFNIANTFDKILKKKAHAIFLIAPFLTKIPPNYLLFVYLAKAKK